MIEPVRASVTLHRPREAAFTAEIGRWWPVKVFSISMEPGPGGEVYEERDDGVRLPWGTVLAWSPPERQVLSWHPGYPAEVAQEVEVRFSAHPEGTLVELEHRHWERLGERAQGARASHEGGWRTVAVDAGRRNPLDGGPRSHDARTMSHRHARRRPRWLNRAHLLGTVLALAPPLTATAAQGDVRSPTLRRFVPADDGALATFWRSAERNGTPLIESIPGDTVNLLVTFLFRGDGGTRSVHPESNIVDPLTPPQKRSAPATTTFARLGATNLWWLNVEAPRTLRAPYALVATSRHLRDVLVAKGYRVTYREFVGVHHDVDWEDAFARAVSGSAGDRGR